VGSQHIFALIYERGFLGEMGGFRGTLARPGPAGCNRQPEQHCYNAFVAINPRIVGYSEIVIWSIDEKSRLHSLTLEEPNGRRTLATSPDSNTYSLPGISFGH
jgi:hypothetical protein